MQRIAGVDVARGLAVLGMVAAHVGDDSAPGAGWLIVTHGRSAATFATLAGLSIALLSGGPRPVARSAWHAGGWPPGPSCSALIGVLLMALGTPVAVILPSYALMFLLVLPVIGWSRRALLVAAGVVLALGPPLWASVADRPTDLPISLLLGRFYPAVVWPAYLLVGLALGRSELRSGRTRAVLGLGGAVLVVLGYGGGRLVEESLPLWSPQAALFATTPHANTWPEVLGNLGVVALVLLTCLVVAERAPRAIAPLAATGALALTAYCGHLLAIAAAPGRRRVRPVEPPPRGIRRRDPRALLGLARPVGPRTARTPAARHVGARRAGPAPAQTRPMTSELSTANQPSGSVPQERHASATASSATSSARSFSRACRAKVEEVTRSAQLCDHHSRSASVE